MVVTRVIEPLLLPASPLIHPFLPPSFPPSLPSRQPLSHMLDLQIDLDAAGFMQGASVGIATLQSLNPHLWAYFASVKFVGEGGGREGGREGTEE